jgi:Ni/Fe-hydrogenase 1 B-type cytochrome subunit
MVNDIERAGTQRGPVKVRYVQVPRRTATWRWIHWIQFTAILVCAATGFYIADPFFSPHIADAMAWDIAIHLYGALLLDVSVFVIGYLYLFSRAEHGIDQLLPTHENLVGLKEAFLNLVTVGRRKRFDTSGPDPLNALWFLLLHVLIVFQLFTGLQLYVEELHGGLSSIGAWWPDALHFFTDWTVPAFGGAVGVRMLHYATMWFILSWAVLHVYYEWWRTIVWREGDIGIMFGGYKFVTRPVDGATAPAANGAPPARRAGGDEQKEAGDAA